ILSQAIERIVASLRHVTVGERLVQVAAALGVQVALIELVARLVEGGCEADEGGRVIVSSSTGSRVQETLGGHAPSAVVTQAIAGLVAPAGTRQAFLHGAARTGVVHPRANHHPIIERNFRRPSGTEKFPSGNINAFARVMNERASVERVIGVLDLSIV